MNNVLQQMLGRYHPLDNEHYSLAIDDVANFMDYNVYINEGEKHQ